jgi:hypothetical protein
MPNFSFHFRRRPGLRIRPRNAKAQRNTAKHKPRKRTLKVFTVIAHENV